MAGRRGVDSSNERAAAAQRRRAIGRPRPGGGVGAGLGGPPWKKTTRAWAVGGREGGAIGPWLLPSEGTPPMGERPEGPVSRTRPAPDCSVERGRAASADVCACRYGRRQFFCGGRVVFLRATSFAYRRHGSGRCPRLPMTVNLAGQAAKQQHAGRTDAEMKPRPASGVAGCSDGDDDDEISVGCPSPTPDDDDVVVSDAEFSDVDAGLATPSSQKNDAAAGVKSGAAGGGVRSFSILDILNHRPAAPATSTTPG